MASPEPLKQIRSTLFQIVSQQRPENALDELAITYAPIKVLLELASKDLIYSYAVSFSYINFFVFTKFLNRVTISIWTMTKSQFKSEGF